MDTKKLITILIIAGTIFLTICVAIIVISLMLIPDQDKSTQSPTDQSIGDLSYTSLCDRANNSTEAQWEKIFNEEIKGQPVTWSGKVTEVFQDSAGAYHTWVYLGNSFSGNDVRLNNLDPDTALALDKNQQIQFSGTIDYFGHLCIGGLVNVKIQ